eukprot:m.7890 g.7890  ORF g.7890 m.7890 type:complete len:914 (+) comp5299_c0_seq1:553-3294(+)
MAETRAKRVKASEELKLFPFAGEPLEEYKDFVRQLQEHLRSKCGKVVDHLVPREDRKALLNLFQYHVNNVGNPDGKCRYGLATRGIELSLLNTLFDTLHLNPYGLKYKGLVDPESSFGYFTLGHQEAAIWALKAARTRMQSHGFNVPHVVDDGANTPVRSAATLVDMTVCVDVHACPCDVPAEVCKCSIVYCPLLPPHATDAVFDRIRSRIRALREQYGERCYVHLQASNFGDLLAFGEDYNILLPNSNKYLMFPPLPGTKFDTSKLFFVDSISLSASNSSECSVFSGVLLTTSATQKEFNSATVAYIDAEDSTVVGSANGHLLLIDHYFYTRFPPQSVHSASQATDLEEAVEYLRVHHLSSAQRQVYLSLNEYMALVKRHSMGYPANHLWSDRELDDLFLLLIQHKMLRNMENPVLFDWVDLRLSVSKTSKGEAYVEKFRREIVQFFEELFFPHDVPGTFHGFVTTGGTEGNYAGLMVAHRELGPDAMLFLTSETHYSVSKGAAIFNLPTVQVLTSSEVTGAMDPDDLRFKILANRKKNPNLKVVVNVNIASTLKGSIDNLRDIHNVLDACDVATSDRWLHCDGALQGPMLPFCDDPAEVVPFILAHDDPRYVPINSIAISGHKFLGAPFPCGVCLLRSAPIVKTLVVPRLAQLDSLISPLLTPAGSPGAVSPVDVEVVAPACASAGIATSTTIPDDKAAAVAAAAGGRDASKEDSSTQVTGVSMSVKANAVPATVSVVAAETAEVASSSIPPSPSSPRLLSVQPSTSQAQQRRVQRAVKHPARYIREYLQQFGSITTGSRNDYLIVVIWKRIKQLGMGGLKQYAQHCFQLAAQGAELINAARADTGIRAQVNPHSNIILLRPAVSVAVAELFNLPITQDLGSMSHIDVLPHVTLADIEQLVEAMKRYPPTV